MRTFEDGGTPEPGLPATAPQREWREGDITCRIVEAVAASAGGDVTDVVPLYDVLDPDALERLFRPSAPSRADANPSVRFEYEGHVVTVDGDGDVDVRRLAPDGPRSRSDEDAGE
jgi:hypothetical protein